MHSLKQVWANIWILFHHIKTYKSKRIRIMKKIVVTGAAGFIGSHLVGALSVHGDLEILAIDNLKPSYGGEWSKLRQLKFSEKINFLEVDLATLEPEKIAKLFDKADSVIHLAGWAGVRAGQLSPLECEKSNLVGFANVLKAVKLTSPNQFLFASSSSVYGNLGSLGMVNEEAATGLNLKSFYSQTKWSNEILAKLNAEKTNLSTIALRFFTVYGEWGRPDMAYWKFLENMISGKLVTLYGRTGGTRNFTYVRDAVQIVEKLLNIDTKGFTPINITSGPPIETLKMLEVLAKISGITPMITITKRPSVDVARTWADITKLNSLIGPQQYVTLEDGMQKFYDWYFSEGQQLLRP
jgi:UDP-glucuronate 4-epimerase